MMGLALHGMGVWVVASVVRTAIAEAPADGRVTPSVAVSVVCERGTGKGRLRCDVELRADDPSSVAWADVQIIGAPAFVTLLRGRVGPLDATVRTPRLWRLPFAIAATGEGTGALRVRVRYVACVGAACEPVQQEMDAPVVVAPHAAAPTAARWPLGPPR
jgi:hypothetical protein